MCSQVLLTFFRCFLLLDLCTRLPLLKKLQVFRLDISYIGALLQCSLTMAVWHPRFSGCVCRHWFSSVMRRLHLQRGMLWMEGAYPGMHYTKSSLSWNLLRLGPFDSDKYCILGNLTFDFLCLGISFQSMLVHATYAFHILLTLI